MPESPNLSVNSASTARRGLDVLKNIVFLPVKVAQTVYEYRRRVAQVSAAFAVVLGLAYMGTRKDTKDIEMQHDGYEFTLKDLTLEEKVAQLFHGSAYGSRAADLTDRGLNHRKLPIPVDFSDWLTDWLKSDHNIGGVHLFRSDSRSLEETNRTIVELMADSKIPPFISMDIVGGYTKHLGLKREEARAYGVPEEFLQIAKENGGLVLPAQEDLGRYYESLSSTKEKVEYRLLMEEYGLAIGRLCRDLGVTINFSPVLDLVEDKNGSNFMEKNDEAYSDDILTVMTLGFHYMKGFQQEDGVMLAPKHFAGTGKMTINPHEDQEQEVTGMTSTDGSFMPFNDAINGRLFKARIHRGHKFDFKLRWLLNNIEVFKVRGSNQRLEAERNSLKAHLEAYGIDPNDIDEQFTKMRPVDGMMVGHAQNFTNREVPGSLSGEIIHTRLRKNMGFDGIVWTDDLSMGAIRAHANSEGCAGGVGSLDESGEVFVRALEVGVTMPMMLHGSDRVKDIAATVGWAIESEADLDNDGYPDITIEYIDASVRKVLEKKAELGLLTSKRMRNPDTGRIQTVYRNNSEAYLEQTMGR